MASPLKSWFTADRAGGGPPPMAAQFGGGFRNRRGAPNVQSRALPHQALVRTEAELRNALLEALASARPEIIVVEPIYLTQGPLTLSGYIGPVRIVCRGEGAIIAVSSAAFIIGDRGDYGIAAGGVYSPAVMLIDCIVRGAAGKPVLQGASTANQATLPVLIIKGGDFEAGVLGTLFDGDHGDVFASGDLILAGSSDIDRANFLSIVNARELGAITLATPGATRLVLIGNKNTARYNLAVTDDGGSLNFLIEDNYNLGDVNIDLGTGKICDNVKFVGAGSIDCTGTSSGLLDGNVGYFAYTAGGLTAGTNV